MQTPRLRLLVSVLDPLRQNLPDWVAGSNGLRTLLEPVEERPSLSASARSATRASSLLVVLAALVWASGQPYLFPSLGPTAYALAVSPSAATSQPQRVFGGHLFGVLAGLLAYHLLAPGLSVVHVPPAYSLAGLRLAASAVLAVGLTSAAMVSTDLRHAPACATTLIVALGLLTTLWQAIVVLSAILLLVAVDRLLPGFGGVENPPS